MLPTHVNELRLVVTVGDFEESVRLYRDVLGLQEVDSISSPGGQVAILSAGQATVELADAAHAAYIDDVEVGRRVAGHVRVAFGVDDVAGTTDRLAAAGAELLAPPVPTPWGTSNARLNEPSGLQLTLFGPLAMTSDVAEPA